MQNPVRCQGFAEGEDGFGMSKLFDVFLDLEIGLKGEGDEGEELGFEGSPKWVLALRMRL